MEKNCNTCKFATLLMREMPCIECDINLSNWQPADISPDLCCGITDSVVSQGEPCSNCKETINPCACMRNICRKCGKPVGNITFAICDECWNAEFPNSPKQSQGEKREVFEKEREWISVKDRLPKRNQNVLIAREKPFHTYLLTAFQRDGIFYSNQNALLFGKVTHWMPLPKPPVVE